MTRYTLRKLIFISTLIWCHDVASASCPLVFEVYSKMTLQSVAESIMHNPDYVGTYVRGNIGLIVLDGKMGHRAALRSLQAAFTSNGGTVFDEDIERVVSFAKPDPATNLLCLSSLCFLGTSAVSGIFSAGNIIYSAAAMSLLSLSSAVYMHWKRVKILNDEAFKKFQNLTYDYQKLVTFGVIKDPLPLKDGVYFLLAEKDRDVEWLEKKGFKYVPLGITRSHNGEKVSFAERQFELILAYNLTLLGLEERPESLEKLRQAYEFAKLRYHPDWQGAIPQTRMERIAALMQLSTAFHSIASTYFQD